MEMRMKMNNENENENESVNENENENEQCKVWELHDPGVNTIYETYCTSKTVYENSGYDWLGTSFDSV